MPEAKGSTGKEPIRRKHIRHRRENLLMLSAATMAGLAIVALWNANAEGPENLTPVPQVSDDINAFEEAMLLTTAQAAGVLPSPLEQDLWANAFGPAERFTPGTEESMPELNQRFFSVMASMHLSENPYFQDTYNHLVALLDAGRLEPVFYLEMDSEGERMFVRPKELEDGRLGYELGVEANWLLNGTTGRILAAGFVHEDTHLAQLEDYFNSLPNNLTVTEKLVMHQTLLEQTDRRLVMEVGAYATEAQAYIYQAGLLNEDYDEHLTSQEERAVEFIYLGADPESIAWYNFIQTVLTDSTPD